MEGIPMVPQTAIQDGLFSHAKAVQGVLELLVSREDLVALVHLGDQATHYEAASRPAQRATKRKFDPPGAHLDLSGYCRDLAHWPRSWMGFEKDLPPGEKLVACFQPFLEHLVASGLSRKTIRKHIDNLWVLGGEIIRDLN